MAETITDMSGYFEKFSTDKACREYLVNKFWKDGPICPYCGNTGKNHRIYAYKSRPVNKCSQCNNQFSVTTGTIFADSKLPLRKIFLAYYLISMSKKGMSAPQLGRALGISTKSAHYLYHKFRISLSNIKKQKLSKTVEVDETYVGGKKKGGKRGRGSENKTPVFGMLERGGDLILMPVPDTKRKTLVPIILKNVERGSKIMSDEWWAYTKLGKYYAHDTVNHRKKEYVRGNVHTNSIEGAWSLFKNALRGTHHRPSKKHLLKYCDEFAFRFNTRHNTDFARFEKALSYSNVRIKQKQIS